MSKNKGCKECSKCEKLSIGFNTDNVFYACMEGLSYIKIEDVNVVPSWCPLEKAA